MIKEFEDLTGITADSLRSRARTPEIVDARLMYYKLRREKSKWGLQKIADDTNRTHATVMQGIKSINGLIEMNDSAAVALWNKVKNIKSR